MIHKQYYAIVERILLVIIPLSLFFCLLSDLQRAYSKPIWAEATSDTELKKKGCSDCEAILEGVKLLTQESQERSNFASERLAYEHFINEYCMQIFIPPSEKKICYYLVPMQRTVASYLEMQMPHSRACNKLAKSNPDVCEKEKTVPSKYLEGDHHNLEASNTLKKKRPPILE
mmetsp:Transcript_2391/g.3369  ORF Transcript_2391/g.3369 Transcript_2391/m.3369 type:complete len:173 (-) Transcript_2391:339-857(-)